MKSLHVHAVIGSAHAPLRFSMVVALVVGCLVMAVPSAITAQTVSGDNNLEFGSLFRASTKSIAYSSADAARFTVTGGKGRNVRLTVSKTNVYANWLSLSAVVLISNSDCAFSTNGGSTWTTFSSGSLYHNTKFPSTGGTNTTILVRVGGTVVSGLTQRRGDYVGLVTLKADYL